jgi:YesN/AraC family two-component response regulator
MNKIYLVEDSLPILARLRELVTTTPGTELVGEAGNASEAIEGILQACPDMVLLDLNLAEGSGFDVLRSLQPRLPGVEFFMLSNFASFPYRQLAARLGAKDYFDKTKDFDRVRELVAQRAEATTH